MDLPTEIFIQGRPVKINQNEGGFTREVIEQLQKEPRVIVLPFDVAQIERTPQIFSKENDPNVPDLSNIGNYVECSEEVTDTSNVEAELNKMFGTICDESSGISIDESKGTNSSQKRKSSKRKDLRSLLIKLFGSPLDDIEINTKKKRSRQKLNYSRRHTSLPVSIHLSNKELLIPLKVNKKRKSESDANLSSSFNLKHQELSQVCELPKIEFTSTADLVEIKMEKETASSSTTINEKCWAMVDVKPEIQQPDSIETVKSKDDIIDLTTESSEIHFQSSPQEVKNTMTLQNGIKIEILEEPSSQLGENVNASAPSMPLLSPVSAAEAAHPETTLPETTDAASALETLLMQTSQTLQTLENRAQSASSQSVNVPTNQSLSVSTNSSSTQEIVPPIRSVIQEIMQQCSEQQQQQSIQQQQQQAIPQPNKQQQSIQQQQHQGIPQPNKSPHVQTREIHSGIPPSICFRQIPSKSPVLTTQSQSASNYNSNNKQLFPTARTEQQLQPPPPKRQKQTGASFLSQPNMATANNSNLLSTSVPQHTQIQQTVPVVANRVTAQTFFPPPNATLLPSLYPRSSQFQQFSNRNQQQQVTCNTQPVPQPAIHPNWNQQNQRLSQQQKQQIQQQRPAPQLIRLYRPTYSPNQYHLLTSGACAEKLFIHIYFFIKWKDAAYQFLQQMSKFLSHIAFKANYDTFNVFVQQSTMVFGRKMIQEILSIDVDSFNGNDILNRISTKLQQMGYDSNMYKVGINFYLMLKSCEVYCTSPFTQKFFNYIMTVAKRIEERSANSNVSFTISQLRRLNEQIQQYHMITNWIQNYHRAREVSVNNKVHSTANSRPSPQQQHHQQQRQPEPQPQQVQPQKQIQFSLTDLLATQKNPDRSGINSTNSSRSNDVRNNSVSSRNNTVSDIQRTQVLPVQERACVQSFSHNDSNLVPAKILPEVNSCSVPSSSRESAVETARPSEEVPKSSTSIISPVTNKGTDDIIDLTWIDEGDENAMIEEITECKSFLFKVENHDESETNNMSVREVVSPADSGLGSPVHQSEHSTEIYRCLCGNEAIFVCACKTSMYCSKDCQINDWVDHQKWCQEVKP